VANEAACGTHAEHPAKGVDAHLVYRAERIQGRTMPLDNLSLRMDLVDGVVALRPLTFRFGRGRITIDVLPMGFLLQ
jgi:hypothetical protein